MAVFNVSFYDVDPLGMFSTTVGGTISYTGPSTADGTAVITDADGVLQDTGSETATADITIGATTSTGSGVYAEEVWTVRDTVTGEEFQITTLRVETGDATGYYTLSEQPLVPGRVYETVSYDTVPETSAGDEVFTYADYVGPLDGIVEGTAGDDVIDGDYTGDPEGDQVDELDNISELQPTSVHSWADQGVADEADISGGLSGTTDGIQVDVTITQETNFTASEMETTDALYDYNDVSDTSSLMLYGGADGTDPNAATVTIDFSSTDVTLQDEVVDVQFGIFDIDELDGQFIDQVTIRAYDADGNEIEVYITAGDPTTISVVDNTATAIVNSGGGGGTDDITGYIEIYIPGPVAKIVIDYNNVDDDHGNHAIRIGDLTFNSVSLGSDQDLIYGGDGNDIIDGGIASDTMYGDADNDTIIAGVGDDTIYGGADADTIQLDDGFGNDTVEGGETGTDQDVIDATNLTGGVTVTMSGDESGAITDGTSTGTFIEIEGFDLTDQSDVYDGTLSTADQTISGNAGSDTITGGTGDDSISGGDDADIIFINDNFGTDSIAGGEGGTDTDTLDASSLTSGVDVVFTGSETGTLTDGTDTATFAEIESFFLTGSADTFDGSSGSTGVTVFSGDGTDTITGGSGADSIDSGTGADTVDGGAGDDTINTGDGADTILLSDNFGSDIITAGEGGTDTDTLDASTLTSALNILLTGSEAGTATDGTDTATFSEVESFVLTTNDDTFDGSAGSTSVTVDAGAGDDTVIGGTGADTFYGGTGSDTITLNTGDVATGGDGDDTFIIDTLAGGPTDMTITGGEGDETLGDTLDLQGQINDASDIVYSGGDNESGTITLIDGSVITFSEIETIFICFAYGTHIMTDRGDRPIQSLEIGDRVITRDHGMQKIRWIGSRKVPAKDEMAPILFKQGVFKNTRDLVVSPQHRMLFQGEQAELMFGQSEVLVPAKQLLGNDGVYQVIDGFVEYFHVLFDNHEIIYAEGSATESYHPGDYSLGEIGEASREEIFNIFPELRSTPNAYGPTARTCLKPYEGRLLKI